MDNTSNFFPDSAIEAIAYLYVQNQDLSGKSPSEIFTIYQEAYFEIRKDNAEKINSGWYNQKKKELKQPQP